MLFRLATNVLLPTEDLLKVTAIAFSPNGKRLAVVTTDRTILLFDEEGEKRDKFPTKPADKAGPKTFLIRDLAFSPDSTQLAIAQSDNSVFVYRLGENWGDKKSICNKFVEKDTIMAMRWPHNQENELVYALSEGKVKVGQLNSNKGATLYKHESCVVAMDASPEGTAVVVAHLDGTIFHFDFANIAAGHRVLVTHPSPPSSIAYGDSIAIAGADRQITFYHREGGNVERIFDYSEEEDCQDFECAVRNPTGQSVVFGNYNKFYVFSKDPQADRWDETSVKEVENMYSVTALGWRADGSRLAVGSVCGLVDVYDVCLRRQRYKGAFEFTFVSPSQAVVKTLATGERISLKSIYGCEITKINIYKDRYVIANTTRTLLLADLLAVKCSEIHWDGDGSEKFIFDYDHVCVVFYAGEITVIEYGENEIIGSVRTDHISPHLLSLRVHQVASLPPSSSSSSVHQEMPRKARTLAYLLDAQTASIKDLDSPMSITVSHDCRIDFLELNVRGNLLLFRDERKHLLIFNADTQTKSTLLDYCTYAQWVPDSDVAVAQHRTSLCVWYNIYSPDQVTIHDINGDIEEIERGEGRTEVIVNEEGFSQASYVLDEPLIRFGSAVEDGNYLQAMDILEDLELTTESHGLWNQLGDMALQHGDLFIARRCAAAVGDISKADFLEECMYKAEKAALRYGGNGMDSYEVMRDLALLRGDVHSAADMMVSQGKIDDAIEMLRNLHREKDAVRLAEECRHPDAALMRRQYFNHLLDTHQEEEAAKLKEDENDLEQAIQLYLKGGLPGKAFSVIQRYHLRQPQLLDQVASSLIRNDMYDKAGEILEQMDQLQRALDAYIRGQAFRKAVELARRSFPSQVVDLEEMWGDHLASQNQMDMAINHFIEAKVYKKAVEGALASNQLTRALQLLEAMEPSSAIPYYKKVGKHYQDLGNYQKAERCYVEGGVPQLAVEMYTLSDQWELAHKLATSYMSRDEVALLYTNQAQRLEEELRFFEAEKLYLMINDVNMAIDMYKRHRKHEDMIRLTEQYRRSDLKETHQYIAHYCEVSGNWQEAEHHYIEASEWVSAVNMYRSNEMWDDAIRVSKLHGGLGACKRITVAYVMAVGIEEASKLLVKYGLVETTIEHLEDTSAYELAFQLARLSLPSKLPDVHLKHALFLEDEENFEEAEREFIRAEKPREAVDMYVHNKDWQNALRVAELHDPESISEVFVAQARSCMEDQNVKRAEELFITAKRPELALEMYQSLGLWKEALQLAQYHLPHKVDEVRRMYQMSQASEGSSSSKDDFLATGRMCENQGAWAKAIDVYLRASEDQIANPLHLEEIWSKAVRIASSQLPTRLEAVLAEVSTRLSRLGRYETAADLLVENGKLSEAVQICMAGKCYQKAKELARGQASLLQAIDSQQERFMKEEQNTDALMGAGKTSAALDVFAQRGDWRQLWEVAKEQSLPASVLANYSSQQIQQIVEGKEAEHDFEGLKQAVDSLSTYGGIASSKLVATYFSLARLILSRSSDFDKTEGYFDTVKQLKAGLFKVASDYRDMQGGSLPSAFEDALMATHYYYNFIVSTHMHSMPTLSLKIAVTLLRYTHVIAADKVFYLVGTMARDRGEENLSFMTLNRYVDIVEAIEEQDASLIDPSDFSDADNVRFDFELPKEQYLTDSDAREEIKDWVLELCTTSSVSQSLPSPSQAQGTVYEALFASREPLCIVTGFPIPPKNRLEVNGSIANKENWNFMVSRTRKCPWTGKDQTPIY
jgi:intraflagellar transport protein 172